MYTHTDTHMHRDQRYMHTEIHAHTDVYINTYRLHTERYTHTQMYTHRYTHRRAHTDESGPCLSLPRPPPSSVTSLSLMRLSLQRKLSCCVCVTQTQKHKVEAFCPCCDHLPGAGAACVLLRPASRRSGSVLPQGEDGRMRVWGLRPWRSVWTPAWPRRRGQHEPPGRWHP